MRDDDLNPYAPPRGLEGEPAVEAKVLFDGVCATVEPIPEPYGGRRFTTRHVLVTNVLGFSPALICFCGAGLIATAFVLYGTHGLAPATPLGLIGAACICVGVVISTWYQLLLEDLYASWKMKAAIALRPDAVVNPGNPEVVAACIAPREHWKSVRLEIASDIGLLEIDTIRGEVRFEGDHDRYRMPREAILNCQPECFHHPLDALSEHWLIHFDLQMRDGVRELLVALSHTDFRPRTNKIRSALVSSFCQRVNALTPRNV